MNTYTKEDLRSIFQRPFNREAWNAVIVNIFRANKLRKDYEKFTTDEDKEDGFYMGAIETSDGYRIGVFYYKIKRGSVAHKKVGLRNLVRKFINPTWGEFDAALVVFNDEKEWRLSFVCDIKEESTTPKRFTFVFGEHDNLYRTAIERFHLLQTGEATFENIRKAFSVDALSDDFFNQYREMYADFVQYITGKRYVKESNKWVERVLGRPNSQYTTTFSKDDKLVRDYIKKMFGRIVFLYFLQRKGWMAGNRNYMHDLFASSPHKDNFLDKVLEPLFFEVLNTDKDDRTEAAKALPGSESIPYLNGGLFACEEIDQLPSVFPEKLFRELFDFLDSYNFTIDENDSEDAEIGIDPEMLGRIFENLLEDNKDKGVFYTPKEIVAYMCRESIIAYLVNALPEQSPVVIRKFVETLNAEPLNEKQRKDIRRKLQAIKICDPAIGSGAFPMGLINLLSKLYVAMKVDTDTATMKRYIMEKNIYGVDIERGAVDIARLRFWLAMIVEEKEPLPLPNLHFKIMQGNSLLERYKSIDLSDLTQVNANRDIFDSDEAERADLLNALRTYYKTSDHTQRDRIFKEITNNVCRQLCAKQVAIPANIDPSANDQFFLWHTWFADVFDKGGFDIVIGNPPYIKEKDNKSAFDNLHESPYYKGKMDLWFMFVCKGIDFLKQDGILTFIAQNQWYTSSGASIMREKIRTEAKMLRINDFNSYMVFSSASTQTMIMLLQKNSQNDIYDFLFRKILSQTPVKKDMFDCIDNEEHEEILSEKFEYVREKMKDKTFVFSNSVINNIIEKVREKTNFQFTDKEIGQGIIGAPDEAFKFKQNIFDQLSPQEKCIAKPFHTVTSGFSTPMPDGYIFYSSKETMPTFNKKDYPIFYNNLKPFEEKLQETRMDTPGIKWWNLWRWRDSKFFKQGEKLIWTSRSTGKCFTYTDEEFYGSRNLFFIKSERVNLKFMCGFLNSTLCSFIMENTLKHNGALLQIDKVQFQSLPLYVPSKRDQESIAKIVDKILLKTSQNNSISAIAEERELDFMFYKLYNLTYDEVLIVDPETPISRSDYEA